MCIRKLFPIVDSNFFFNNLLFITLILYPIFSILTLLAHQALLASLLGIIGNVNSYNIVLNSTQSFSINTGIRECPGNIVVKDIKGTPPLRLRLLKLQISNGKLFKNKKTHFNTTATLTIYTPIIRTKGIRFYIISFIIYLQNFLIGFLVLKRRVGKIIQTELVPITS